MIDLIALGFVAGMFPVYLGIVVALMLGKVLPRSWEGALIGVAIGVLVYLFFDLMHESVELTGSRDSVSWLVFLGSLGTSFVGLVAIERNQVIGSNRKVWPSEPVMRMENGS
jgi:zinc transporter, ZIP family